MEQGNKEPKLCYQMVLDPSTSFTTDWLCNLEQYFVVCLIYGRITTPVPKAEVLVSFDIWRVLRITSGTCQVPRNYQLLSLAQHNLKKSIIILPNIYVHNFSVSFSVYQDFCYINRFLKKKNLQKAETQGKTQHFPPLSPWLWGLSQFPCLFQMLWVYTSDKMG